MLCKIKAALIFPYFCPESVSQTPSYHKIQLVASLLSNVYSSMVLTGLDRLEKAWTKKLKGLRVGLLVHPASVNRKLEHAVNVFFKSKNSYSKRSLAPSTE